jgi:type I restriction enzyme S subunit
MPSELLPVPIWLRGQASQWPVMTIAELLQAGVVKGHKDGNHGSLYPRVEDFGSEGVPFLTAKLLSDGRVDIAGAPRLADEKADKLRLGFVQVGDVLLSHNATIGRVAVVPSFAGRLLIGTSLTYFRLDERRLLPRYLAAYFNGQDFQNQLKAVMSHTTRNQVPITAQRFLRVVVPPVDVQQFIASTLGSIDDRINLLRQTNATLESIAQALFKSWFIHFDPVRAKAEGREPEGMDAATAALFPAKFEESALGLIPKGWESGKLDVICTNPRAQAKPGQMSADTAYIGLEHMPRKSIALDSVGTVEGLESGKFWFERNDVLFGKLRPYFHKVGLAPSRGVCSTDILVLRPKVSEWLGILAMHASSDALVSYTTQLSNGARMPRTSWRDVGGFDVVLPLQNVAAAFNAIVSPMFERIHANIERTRVLTELRDTLLPRLISGKLRLPEAQALAQARP